MHRFHIFYEYVHTNHIKYDSYSYSAVLQVSNKEQSEILQTASDR